ncbi:MAG: hypothetical protein JWR67_2099 [Mucilaginibacter sp.]|nr:hypothetical protein [Mucilaginibacter sp.]
MTSTFIKHELKAFWRARNTGKSIAVHIVMGLMILYLLACALGIGFFMDRFLKQAFPKDDLVFSFCGIILIYYLFELLSRMQLQELPTLRVQPYLQLAVTRNSLVRYLAFTAMLSFFNLWPLILFIPFILKVVAVKMGGVAALVFILSVIGFSIFNNYLALYIKRKASLNGWVFLVSSLCLILIGMGDFKWHLYSIRNFSYLFFGHLATQPLLVLVPILLAIAMYYTNFLFLKQNLYLEELTKHKTLRKSTTEFPLLDRFGNIGDLVANEIKLIIRNKRPSSALKVSLFFLFYGLIFYNNPKIGEYMKLLVGMFMTGIFIISYGQYMYGWQANHFDGIMVSKVSFTDFLKAKYLLFTLVSTAAFLLTLPYVYFGWRTVMIHFIMYLWNLGVNTTIVLFFANRNSKRIDLSKGAAFNWEGVGVTQLLLSIPLMLAPYIIYIPLKLLAGNNNLPLVVIALLGMIGIFTRGYWIKLLTADFYNRKFKIAEGFRDK